MFALGDSAWQAVEQVISGGPFRPQPVSDCLSGISFDKGNYFTFLLFTLSCLMQAKSTSACPGHAWAVLSWHKLRSPLEPNHR